MDVGTPSHPSHPMVAPNTNAPPVGATNDRRHCSRSGCSERAAVTLTYDYRHSHVWLDELIAERDPHAYDLCVRHAARLSVPHGWRLDDRRMLRQPVLLAV